MTHGNRSTFLAPSAGIQRLFGVYEIHYIDLKGGAPDLGGLLTGSPADSVEKERVILAVHADPLRELLEKITGFFSGGRGRPQSMRRLRHDLASFQWRVKRMAAAFPNFNSARFFLPFDDDASHRFLVNDILVPRRYSLPLFLRLCIHLYNIVLKTLNDSSFLYRYVYILVERT